MSISNKQLLNLFNQGPNISIYPSGNSYAISGSPSGIISGANAGTGINFLCGFTTTNNTNDTLVYYTLSGGNQVSIGLNDNGEIIIDRGQEIVNTLSNQGTGARIYSAISVNTLASRTIQSAGSGFTTALGNAANAITDSDATAFITAASITSTTQIIAISNLVFDLKAANLWNKMNAIYPIVGGTENSHKYNLKDPRDLNDAFRLSFLGGGWTHNASGMTPNGTTSYADTFLTAATSLSVSNGHLSFYSRVQSLSGANIEIGASINSSAIICALAVGRSTNQSIFWWGNQGAGTLAILSSSLSTGFFIGNQNGATAAARNIYRNASVGTAASNYNNTSLGAIPSITIGARNDAAGVDSFSTKQCAFASIGSGLTASEISSFNTIVEAYQTTLGRQVIASTTRGVNTLVRTLPTNTTLDRFYNITTGPVLNTFSLILPSATTGNMGIGIAPVTTSRLLAASGSATISQIDLTAFSNEPTNPPDGSIWFSTSGNTLRFEKGTVATDFIFKDNNNSLSGYQSILAVDTGGTITPKYVNSLGLFDSTPTVVSFYSLEENIEKSIIPSTIVGSTTLLASTNLYNPELAVGRKYRYTAKGSINADTSISFGTPYLNINIKLGSTTIITNQILYGIYIDGPNVYSSEFEIDVTFTIRNSGLVVGSGKIIFLTFPPSGIGGSGDPVIFGLYSQDATIDTTINQIFDCTCYLTGGGVDMYIDTFDITVNESFLEILN